MTHEYPKLKYLNIFNFNVICQWPNGITYFDTVRLSVYNNCEWFENDSLSQKLTLHTVFEVTVNSNIASIWQLLTSQSGMNRNIESSEIRDHQCSLIKFRAMVFELLCHMKSVYEGGGYSETKTNGCPDTMQYTFLNIYSLHSNPYIYLCMHHMSTRMCMCLVCIFHRAHYFLYNWIYVSQYTYKYANKYTLIESALNIKVNIINTNAQN